MGPRKGSVLGKPLTKPSLKASLRFSRRLRRSAMSSTSGVALMALVYIFAVITLLLVIHSLTG